MGEILEKINKKLNKINRQFKWNSKIIRKISNKRLISAFQTGTKKTIYIH